MRKFLLPIAVLVCAAGIVASSLSSSDAALVPKRTVLDNGLVLLTSQQRSLPMVSIEILMDAGSRYDGANQEGVGNLVARLLTYGTKRRSALQISDTVDFIGASLSASCGEDVASISLTILKKDLATGLDLLADILMASTFPQEEIDRQKQAVIAGIRAREENPGSIAQRRFAAALYPQSPYGRPVEGSEASVKAISQADLQEFYQRFYRPNRAIMAAVGDISEAEIIQALNQSLRVWSKGEARGKPLVPTAIGEAQVIRVNKDLTQANIILGQNGVGRESPDYYAIQVMNYILGGGGFSSRAMDVIRNERGLAYSVYSYFSAERERGTFELVMQTKSETALEAIRLAQTEIRRIREESVTDQELSEAKDYLIGSFPLRFDTNRRVAAFLVQVEFYQLGLDYPERYTGLIQNVTREDVERVARQYLHPDKLITVIVGDQKKISEN